MQRASETARDVARRVNENTGQELELREIEALAERWAPSPIDAL